MQINILLPYKEKFDKNKASSVSITVKNNLIHTHYLKNIKIYGQIVDQPLFRENFVGVKYSPWSLKSKNVFLAEKMCELIKNNDDDKQIIEIHNRPYLIDKIFKKIKNCPIILFLHNDPQEMKGSKSIAQRENILLKCSAVLCVSNYVKDQFLQGLSDHQEKVNVLYNGVERNLKKIPNKRNEVLFVGRLVYEKGVDLYIKVVKSIAPHFPDWNFGLIGSFRLGDDQIHNSYVYKTIENFKNIGPQAKFYGFKDNNFVQNKMKSTSIIIIPSLWQEPFGLVAAEAMSNGIAIIASKVGGIPEIIKDNGILIENINFKNLQRNLINLIDDNKMRENYQIKAWKNFNHSSNLSSKKLDNFRKIIFQNFY